MSTPPSQDTTATPLPSLPPPIATFPCDGCGRIFLGLAGLLLHRPCGQIRRDGDVGAALDAIVMAANSAGGGR